MQFYAVLCQFYRKGCRVRSIFGPVLDRLIRDKPIVATTSFILPPYNLGVKYGKYNDACDRYLYLNWCKEWAREIKRILIEEGSFFLNIGGSPSNPMHPHQIFNIMSNHFTLQNTFHWIKSITVETPKGEEISVGHFKPINSKRYVTDADERV